MKSALLSIFLATSANCIALDYSEIAGARYSHTAMGDIGVIHQVFVAPSGQSIEVQYAEGKKESVILVRVAGGGPVDAREDKAALIALRSALCAYLRSSDRNERAAVDVSSALCVVSEPALPIFSLVWLGSRGKPLSPELGKISSP